MTQIQSEGLKEALAQIDKQFGAGSVVRLGDQPMMDMESIPTGALSLDLALGIGGLPKGRIIECYGPESSGKSSLALHLIAEAQKEGGLCAYIDAENALDPVYARVIGVDTDELYISQPDTGEQGLGIANKLIQSGGISVVVVDSVAALTPRAEIEGEMGDASVGLQARLMSQAMRKITHNLSQTNTIAFFINQIREKIGVLYGSPETQPGGRALKFFASVRLDIRRIEWIKNGTEMVGQRARVKVIKNKCAPPHRQAEFDILYGQGIDKVGSVLETGLHFGLIQKSGNSYRYGDALLGVGKQNAKDSLREDPSLCAAVAGLVVEQIKLGVSTLDAPRLDVEE